MKIFHENFNEELQKAWAWREKMGYLAGVPVRIFHGPGEGSGALRHFAIDRFQSRTEGKIADHYWVTEWQGGSQPFGSIGILEFLKSKKATSIVGMSRPQKGVPEKPQTYFGTPPSERFVVEEDGLKFWIQLQDARHPGLFLDHQPLRRWLRARAGGMRVLNTFSYTGSLSVAAALGGAEQVTTLDLAKSAIDWAGENMILNGIQKSSRLICGDLFEWIPRLKKSGERYDCIILDPPSFSHSKKGKFSTSQDLTRLHELVLEVLSPTGILVTSINSAQVSWKKYETDLLRAIGSRTDRRKFKILSRIDLPETFPTLLGDEESRYLKGWVLG